MQIAVEGGGVLAAHVHACAKRRGVASTDDVRAADVAVRATPADTWSTPLPVPTVAPALRQQDVHSPGAVTVAGFWGGIGSLLAAVACAQADDPRAAHVAYGFPGARRLVARLSPTVRGGLLRVATDPATARVEGEEVPEPLGEGRRLAWFPRPVGPAHAVAVGGLEVAAALPVPTMRTWVAAGSLAAEGLQALGRRRPDSGVGAWLDRRAAAGGGGATATSDLRWAVVAEVLDGDGAIVRAWANGTDPVRAAGDLVVEAALRVAAAGVPDDGTVVGLGDVAGQLDALADQRTLRWSVSRPEPSRR